MRDRQTLTVVTGLTTSNNRAMGLGTSGHPTRRGLAAVLVGPLAGAVCIAVVLVVQGQCSLTAA